MASGRSILGAELADLFVLNQFFDGAASRVIRAAVFIAAVIFVFMRCFKRIKVAIK
ncbi:hypothetical protein [[Phormidium] sp. ETS-05]|uniref:hypothetical protein n=1 Tax=[Phormidium] sp. ETS-05 TaxID=222819 RepID=UPI0018EF3230|nr:hypothetical protein [[Phormidium] sp. ETS-05]